MPWLKVVVAIYALLNIGGGIEGFATKHSVPSIISGVTAGILLFVGLYVATNNSKIGYGICAVIAIADLGFFAPKFFKTSQVWPAGIMSLVSLAVLACLIAAHFMGRQASAAS